MAGAGVAEMDLVEGSTAVGVTDRGANVCTFRLRAERLPRRDIETGAGRSRGSPDARTMGRTDTWRARGTRYNLIVYVVFRR